MNGGGPSMKKGVASFIAPPLFLFRTCPTDTLSFGDLLLGGLFIALALDSDFFFVVFR